MFALTRNDIAHGSKNLLQRAILYRYEDLLLGRGDCRQRPGKLYVKIGRFFINISGYLCSFGTALFVVQYIGSVQVVVGAGWPRKSI